MGAKNQEKGQEIEKLLDQTLEELDVDDKEDFWPNVAFIIEKPIEPTPDGDELDKFKYALWNAIPREFKDFVCDNIGNRRFRVLKNNIVLNDKNIKMTKEGRTDFIFHCLLGQRTEDKNFAEYTDRKYFAFDSNSLTIISWGQKIDITSENKEEKILLNKIFIIFGVRLYDGISSSEFNFNGREIKIYLQNLRKIGEN